MTMAMTMIMLMLMTMRNYDHDGDDGGVDGGDNHRGDDEDKYEIKMKTK